MHVSDIIERKGRRIYSVSPDASVFDAIRLMEEHGVGALVVLEAGALVGVISERDYARKVILRGRSSKDIMTSDVLVVSPERTLDETMALMTDKRVRHLPVLQDGKLVGVISSGDVIKAMISEKEFIISQLESYIRGG